MCLEKILWKNSISILSNSIPTMKYEVSEKLVITNGIDSIN